MPISPRRVLQGLVLASSLLQAACGGPAPASPVAPSATRLPGSTQVQSVSRDMKAIVEALFLGTGPLARVDSPGCDSTLQRMRGWPRGSRVRAVVYAGVDPERRATVQRTLAQADDAFGSALTTEYGTRDDVTEPDGSPDREIAIYAAPAVVTPALCGSSASNCQVVRYNAGTYISSRVILSTPFGTSTDGIVAHEMGHAFGLCHIDPTRAGLESAASIMGNSVAGKWTTLDIDAITLVYGAGLSPSDSRQRFVAAGLVD